MSSRQSNLLEFGKFRLDLAKRLLWLEHEPVDLPLKAVDLLCVLVERRGEVVTKDEIWHEVWNDAFVEETNLTHNIYLLRKAFKDHGEAELIKTIPRRGYRFTGDVRQIPNGDIVLERHGVTRTLIEFQDSDVPETAASDRLLPPRRFTSLKPLLVSGVVLIAIIGGFVFWNQGLAHASTAAIHSVAVLPLKSFSAGDNDEELRMRITDALITRLGNMKDVAIRPTSAVAQFANDNRNPTTIGAMLQVDAVLDGRVQEEADRVRVTLQLISVENGKQLWSGQFDGQADHLLNLQDKISTDVVGSLNKSEPQKALANLPTSDSSAYEAYLKGRYFWAKRDEVSLRKAIEYFQEAVAADPQFSEAYSGIADAQLLLYDQNIEVTQGIVAQAKETLHQALLLKPDSSEALATLGSVEMSYDWDWKAAEVSLRKATEAAPNSSNAWTRYGMLLLKLGRFDESVSAIARGVALDPLSLIANADLGMAYFCRKDYAASDAQFRRTLEINDRFGVAHWMLSRSLWQQGRKAESVDEIIRGLELDGNDELAGKLRDKARTADPEAVINLLLYEWRNNPEKTNPHNMAYLSTYVNNREQALNWLQRSLDEHHPWTAWLKAAPEFESLRQDPRYQKILTATNLAE